MTSWAKIRLSGGFLTVLNEVGNAGSINDLAMERINNRGSAI
jgi:hypothetical protein